MKTIKEKIDWVERELKLAYIQMNYNDGFSETLFKILNKKPNYNYDRSDMQTYKDICEAMRFPIRKDIIALMEKDIKASDNWRKANGKD